MNKTIVAALAAGVFALSAPAQAGLNSTMRVTGDRQGEIKGSVTQAGREDSIMVIGFSHEVMSPRDAASGRSTGRRQHKPFTVTMPIDRATPLLFNALASNERLTEVTLQLWQPSRAGREENYYTIELVDATVASISLNSGEEIADPHTATVSFAYRKIIETWADGGVTAEDDWGANVRQ